MISWIKSFLSLLFPRYCTVCGNVLNNDILICVKCDVDMPRTNFHLTPDNRLEQLLWGRINVGRATALFFYSKGSPYRHLLFQLKYKGKKELGITLGERLATEISDCNFFDSIEMIIPIPLHKDRQKERGYNQSEEIAFGISNITGIPVVSDCVIRNKYTETQTRKSSRSRIENMEGVFEISPTCKHVSKHILLVDDIITTGATIASCGGALQNSFPDIRISVLAVAVVPY